MLERKVKAVLIFGKINTLLKFKCKIRSLKMECRLFVCLLRIYLFSTKT